MLRTAILPWACGQAAFSENVEIANNYIHLDMEHWWNLKMTTGMQGQSKSPKFPEVGSI